jgi:hypothetical protein
MRNSSLVKCSCAEDDRGSSIIPKLRMSFLFGANGVVEEHSQGTEAEAEASVERWEEIMPE